MTKEQFEAVVANYPEIDRPHLCWIIDTEKRTFQIVRQKYRGAEFNRGSVAFSNYPGVLLKSGACPEMRKEADGSLTLFVKGRGYGLSEDYPIPMNITWDDLYNVCGAVNEYNKAMYEYETKKDTFGHPEFQHWFTTEYTEGYIQAGIKRENLALDLCLSIDQTTGKKSLVVKTQKYRWGNFNPIDGYTNFTASNGIVLNSITYPEWNPSNQKVLYLRGTDTSRDDISLDVSDMSFSELREIYMAAFEYNVALFKYEQKKATPVLSEKELFMQWLKKDLNEPRPYADDPALDIGLNLNASTLRIELQKYRREGFNPMNKADSFTASNGFRLTSGTHPAWYYGGNVLYVQGELHYCDTNVVDIKDMPYETLKALLIAVREYNLKVYEHEQSVLKTFTEDEFLRWYENTYRAKNRDAIYGDDPALRLDIDLDTFTLYIKTQKYHNMKFNPVTTGDHDDRRAFTSTNGFSLHSIAYPHWYADDPSRHNELYLQGETKKTEKVDIKGMPYSTIKKMFEAVHEYNEMIYRHENPLHMHIDYGTGDVTGIAMVHYVPTEELKKMVEAIREYNLAMIKEAEGTEIIGHPDHLQISMTDKTIRVLSLKHKGNEFSSETTPCFHQPGFILSASGEYIGGISQDDIRIRVNFGDDETYDISKWNEETRTRFKKAVGMYNEWCEDMTNGVNLGYKWNVSYILMGRGMHNGGSFCKA